MKKHRDNPVLGQRIAEMKPQYQSKRRSDLLLNKPHRCFMAGNRDFRFTLGQTSVIELENSYRLYDPVLEPGNGQWRTRAGQQQFISS